MALLIILADIAAHQLKIEKFLHNQVLKFNEANLASGKASGYIKISNEIILLFLKSNESLEKLILNYKTNLNY